ncbi:MAG TPA: ATP synthase F1 subunit delta [Chloroflexota bacterium]|nr:ATP synthase F1 subunit delta [Chloroflexota bacterium]
MAEAGGAARRYARAILELALENNQDLTVWLEDLEAIAATFRDPRVAALLDSPRLSIDKKREIADSLFPDLKPLQKSLVSMLVERHRTGLVDSIAREFRRMSNEHRGIVEATVRTAIPVSQSELQAIASRLGAMTGKTVLVSVEVDPTILGGIVARIGDRQINASVAGRLHALHAELVAGAR